MYEAAQRLSGRWGIRLVGTPEQAYHNDVPDGWIAGHYHSPGTCPGDEALMHQIARLLNMDDAGMLTVR